MIRLDLPNIITIALAGMLGYGVLVAIGKTKQLVTGGGSMMGGSSNASAATAATGPA